MEYLYPVLAFVVDSPASLVFFFTNASQRQGLPYW
jgi:hypothetical protein